MRGWTAATVIATALAFILLASAMPSAEAVSSIYLSDIRIEELDSTTSIHFSDVAHFQYLIYNNNTTVKYAVLFYVTPLTDAEGWGVPTERQAFVLAPGEWREVQIDIRSPEDWKGDDSIRMRVNFQVDNLRTNATTYYNQTHNIAIDTSLETWNAKSVLQSLPLPSILETTWGYFIIMLVLWTVVGLSILFVLDPFVKLFTKKTKTEIDDMVIEIVRGPIFWLIAGFGLVSSLEIIGVPPFIAYYLELLYELFLIVIITWVIFKLFKDVLIYYGHHVSSRTDTEFDDILLPVLEKVGAVVIVIGGIVFFLKAVGIDITVFVAGLGIAGLVVAFAAQDTLSNFFSGIFLLADRPFAVGDLIVLEDKEVYEVRDIGIRTTSLYRGVSHDIVVFPNNVLANSRVVNLCRPDLTYKAKVEVGVAYDSDLKRVAELMNVVAMGHPEVLKDTVHLPIIRVMSFGDSAINFTMFFWVQDVNTYWRVASELRQSIHETFKREGIEIPFPQRDIHIRSGGIPPTSSDPKPQTPPNALPDGDAPKGGV